MKNIKTALTSLALGATILCLPNCAYSALADIQYVDFKTFTYEKSDCEGMPKEITVKNGTFKTKTSGYEVGFSVGDIIYGDINSDGNKDAIIVGWCETEGANYWPFQIFIYSLKDGKPILLDSLTEERMAHDYERFYPNGTLRQLEGIKYNNGFLAVDRLADGPHCCPEFVASIPYRLVGNRLMIVSKPTKKKYQS